MSEPKYLEFKEEIKRRIRAGKYRLGEQLPGEYRLMEEMGISRHTILRGMAQLAAEGWVERHQGRGTFVSRRPPGALPGSKTIAFICSEFGHALTVHIMRGITRSLQGHYPELLLLDSSHSIKTETRYLNSLEERGINGLLFWPTLPPANEQQVVQLQQAGIPVVLLDRGYEHNDIPVVSVDNEQGAYALTSYLIQQGHQRIAHITLDYGQGHYLPPVALREKGYRRAMNEHHLAVDPRWIERIPIDEVTEDSLNIFPHRVGYEQTHRLLALQNRPTAIFLLSDIFITGCQHAISNHHLKIPQDIRLASFTGNEQLSNEQNGIICYTQDAEQIGQKATELLLQLLLGEQLSSYEFVIPGHLSA